MPCYRCSHVGGNAKKELKHDQAHLAIPSHKLTFLLQKKLFFFSPWVENEMQIVTLQTELKGKI